MQLQISINQALISFSVVSVFNSYRIASSSAGVGVQSTILSFNSTRSRLYRTRLAPLKPTKILSFIITLLKAT
jgi:hypothetical protein